MDNKYYAEQMIHLTWDEFKVEVERQLAEKGISTSLPVLYIDTYPDYSEMYAHLEDGCIVIT